MPSDFSQSEEVASLDERMHKLQSLLKMVKDNWFIKKKFNIDGIRIGFLGEVFQSTIGCYMGWVCNCLYKIDAWLW